MIIGLPSKGMVGQGLQGLSILKPAHKKLFLEKFEKFF
jgi:hypothetical protein